MNIIQGSKTLVYDLGVSTVQFGFAGDFQPTFNVNSAAFQSEGKIRFGRDFPYDTCKDLQVSNLFKDGDHTIDTDLFQEFMNWSYSSLNVEPREYTVLFSQPVYLANKPSALNNYRKTLCEILFETGSHPGICLEYDAVLSCYAHMKSTALVIDAGWYKTRVVPVVDGKPLVGSIVSDVIGANNIISHYAKSTQGMNRALQRQPYMSDSQYKYNQMIELERIMESTLTFETSGDPSRTTYFYSNTDYVSFDHVSKTVYEYVWAKSTEKSSPLPMAISSTINSTPADVRRQLWKNIILSGGLSKVHGFRSSVEHYLAAKKPDGYSVMVLPPMHGMLSGPLAPWTGGSIVGSLDTFSEMCITSEEYNEYGIQILERASH